MRAIQPIDVWKDGVIQTAVCIKLYISYDDLSTRAALMYQLCDASDAVVYEGQILIVDDTYVAWGASGDSNAQAYVIAATQLNLTLV